jgi:transposase
VRSAPETLPDEIEALKAALAAEHTARQEAEARASGAEAMVAHLKLLIAKLRREQYGQSSGRGRCSTNWNCNSRKRPRRRLRTDSPQHRPRVPQSARSPAESRCAPFPAHLLRERVVIPGPIACPCCGGKLAKLGETITETLEVVPRQWKVIQTVREKFTCRSCKKITQPPAPFHVIPRGHVGPSLLAMILYAKYGEHQPLNRQSETYAFGELQRLHPLTAISTGISWLREHTRNSICLTPHTHARV